MGLLDFFKRDKPKKTYDGEFYYNQTGNRVNNRPGYVPNDSSVGLNASSELYNTSSWVHFGQTNQYPNYFNNLYNSSGLHGAIIDFEQNAISGAGFELEGIEALKPMKKVELEQFMSFFDGTNPLEEVIDALTMDYLIHGTIYLKVFWNSDKTRVLKLKRISPAQVRLGVDQNDKSEINRYFINLDWSQQGNFKTIELPAFNPLVKDDNRIEVFRFAIPNDALLYNTFPSYIGGIDWINVDSETAQFHKSNIQNSINPSMLIKFAYKPANNEERREIVNKIQGQFTGSRNAGQPMILFGDGENTPEVEPVASSDLDKQFNVTAKVADEKICMAHKINPIIMGNKTAGSLGNSQEIAIAAGIYQENVVKPAQKNIERVINKFLKINGLTVTFRFNEVELITNKEE